MKQINQLDLKKYIKRFYLEESLEELLEVKSRCRFYSANQSKTDLDQAEALSINELEDGFSETLRRMIIAKQKTPVEIYKKAHLDRKLWSKIQNDRFYSPSKKTAVAFALALELTLAETNDLLSRAGFTLSRSQLFDVIVEYCIRHQIYDFVEINQALRAYDQALL